MDKNKITAAIMNAIDEYGLIEALDAIFGKNFEVSLPFGKTTCDMNTSDLPFKPRCVHGFKRVEIVSIGDLIDALGEGRLVGVKNLGEKSINEIKTRLLNLSYEKMSESEKILFIWDLIDKNMKPVKK